jgi:hypothetical protein
MSKTEVSTQTIYGFRITRDGHATINSNQVYESKKDLINFITTKDFFIEGSTFKMVGENENHFIEVADDKSFWNKSQLTIFELHLNKSI